MSFNLPKEATKFVTPLPRVTSAIYHSDKYKFTEKLSDILSDHMSPFLVLVGGDGSGRMREIQQLVVVENALADIMAEQGYADEERNFRVGAATITPSSTLNGKFSYDKIANLVNEASKYKDCDGNEAMYGLYLVIANLGSLAGHGEIFAHVLDRIVQGFPIDFRNYSRKTKGLPKNRIIIPLTEHEWATVQNTQPKFAQLANVVHIPEPDEEKVNSFINLEFTREFFDNGVIEHAIDSASRYIKNMVQPGSTTKLLSLAVSLATLEDEKVTVDDVNEAVKELTKVDASAFALPLKEFTKVLSSKIVGQTDGLTRIAKGIKRGSMIGFDDKPRPVYSVMIYGESGIGKTLLAEQIAKLFTGSRKFLRIDAGELKSPELANARLLGMPIGYKGFEQGGLLTEFARRNKSGVILIDEAEKAETGVQDLFMRMVDTGSVISAAGEGFDLTNFVFIFTTNAGVQKEKSVGFGAYSTESKPDPIKELSGSFKNEFLNRFDDIIEFVKLNKVELAQISRNTIENMLEHSKRKGKTIRITKKDIAKLAEEMADISANGRQVYRNTHKRIMDDYIVK